MCGEIEFCRWHPLWVLRYVLWELSVEAAHLLDAVHNGGVVPGVSGEESVCEADGGKERRVQSVTWIHGGLVAAPLVGAVNNRHRL